MEREQNELIKHQILLDVMKRADYLADGECDERV